MEQILETIDNKLYDSYLNMHKKQENVDINNNFNTSSVFKYKSYGEKDSIKNINYNTKDKKEFETLKEKEEINHYFKINNVNILKELFNSFEIFDRSEYKDQNTKNIEHSENDGWEFQKGLTRKRFFNKIIKGSNKINQINFLNINEKKLELNFNGLNSNLNSIEIKNEKRGIRIFK